VSLHRHTQAMKTPYKHGPRRSSNKLRYRVDKAASTLGVPPRSLRYSIHVGLVPVVRDGTGIFILADVLSKFKTKFMTQAAGTGARSRP
jgi:hypothetical protein